MGLLVDPELVRVIHADAIGAWVNLKSVCVNLRTRRKGTPAYVTGDLQVFTITAPAGMLEDPDTKGQSTDWWELREGCKAMYLMLALQHECPGFDPESVYYIMWESETEVTVVCYTDEKLRFKDLVSRVNKIIEKHAIDY